MTLFAMTSSICFVSSCTLTPRFLKICDIRYDISCSCHTSIIQKNACLYNKIHIKFLPLSVPVCPVVCCAAGSRSEAPSQGSFYCSWLPPHMLILWQSWSAPCRYCHTRIAKTVSRFSTVSALSFRRSVKGSVYALILSISLYTFFPRMFELCYIL